MWGVQMEIQSLHTMCQSECCPWLCRSELRRGAKVTRLRSVAEDKATVISPNAVDFPSLAFKYNDGLPISCISDESLLSISAPFRSLRLRLLGPLIATAFLASIVVALASYWLGSRWATDEAQTRFHKIEITLADSSFPLNGLVLASLADLTQTELVAFSDSGNVRQSTIDGTASTLRQAALGKPGDSSMNDDQGQLITISDRRYRVFQFDTVGGSSRADRVSRIAVFFDEDVLDASRRRAAILPLATGLSTILALSSITFVLASRLVGRISKLHQRVEAVAAGDFQSTVSDHVPDEVGRLGGAVDNMARQLDQLWRHVNRQQSEKLLHQIAGGMAHQLRNSLTGARMAVELHAAECDQTEDEGLSVAIGQIEMSEDYVRRLLLVASGRQDEDHPMKVTGCWDDVRSSLSPIAKHLRIDITWHLDETIGDHQVKDGPTWVAAVTNLVHNAMQAGDCVRVKLDLISNHQICLRVSDNGPGVSESVAEELFEPFVTSKPEGLGLGLSVVRRAAEYLGGSVQWKRETEQTVFEFLVAAFDDDRCE